VKLPAYPKYKSSGVEWLGDVPEHWKKKAIKWESPVLRGASPRPIDDPAYFDDEGDYAWVRISDVTTAGMYLDITEQKLSRLGSSLSVKLKPGALFLSIAGSVGKPCIAKIPCCIHDGFVYFPRFKGEPRFLYYLFASGEPYRGLGKLGTQLNLNTDTVGSIIAGFPDLGEQQAIADFLDRETARLDALAAKKQKLIERLKEKRTALISRTVTRGLNSKAKLKPSGIEWLGDIPIHWKVKPVKYIARVGNGSTPNRDNPAYWEDGSYPWLNSSVVNRETVTDSEEFVTKLALAECHLPKIKPPAVLVGITGQGRTRGMASTLLFEATINQHLAYLKPLPDQAEVGFLRRVFDMAYLFFRSESDGGGSTKGAITCEQIGMMNTPVPPVVEQTAIADYLDTETKS
jgi:type I restriction enzyme S subunit